MFLTMWIISPKGIFKLLFTFVVYICLTFSMLTRKIFASMFFNLFINL